MNKLANYEKPTSPLKLLNKERAIYKLKRETKDLSKMAP